MKPHVLAATIAFVVAMTTGGIAVAVDHATASRPTFAVHVERLTRAVRDANEARSDPAVRPFVTWRSSFDAVAR